ncbi:unnamed protein product [Caenorhabditis bovis]|uniref:CSN8/PSMD8/EIF3K domain-containing protein n=1 Tax=Caenorhabditis bovis TaxID=2654633 RepID=A0A8S1FF95_9PELO|nr:unnamed protein product [Caenorhabditis bovis]
MAAAAHKNLLAVWAKQPRDINGIKAALDNLSKALATDTSLNDEQALLADKDLVEITALFSIITGDMATFHATIQSVFKIYEMAPKHTENKYLMIGLNLMFYLAHNRLAEFHMLLEQVPHSEQTSNAYIVTPVRIEQSIMEGAYNKVILTEKNIPSPFYEPFIKTMVDTIRGEIASSIEKSFKFLNIKDAAVMLLCDNEKQLAEFAKMRNWKQDGKSFVFDNVEVAQDKPPTLDTKRIATQTIFYAKQLEQIV